MRKFLVLAMIFAMALTACDDWDIPDDGNDYSNSTNNNNPNNPSTVNTSLKIQNESSFEILDVKWSNVLFTQGTASITNPGSISKTVQEGSGYIYFKRKTNPINVRTEQLVAVEKSEQKVFIINDNTLVVDVDNPANKGTFGSLGSGNTSLKIQNESFSEITDVRWSNVTFTQGTESIQNGKSVIKAVQEGNGYIYFKRKTNPINARTDEQVVITKNEQKVFIINDNTIIVDMDNTANKGTFGTLGVTREPQITVKVGNTPIEHFGDYNFGSVLLNTNKDVTFNIGNSGKADLMFNVVEGSKVINLSNNTSGYFSVNQQPFATMKIIPGGETTFIIRFSPIIKGNNYNAEVTIVTNSENNAEFTFRVKGDGSNEYKIGDTGPGGGMIFYAQGGQYKECSGELGRYNWYTAVTTAQNYRGNGFSNWYLPDKGELDLMYLNLYKKGLGGILNDSYWSSTESGSDYAWDYYFGSSGGQYANSKDTSYRVRAVRSFSL
jgi:hypothetical protein